MASLMVTEPSWVPAGTDTFCNPVRLITDWNLSNAVTSVPHLNIQQVRHARGVLVLTTHGGEIIRGYLVAGSVVFLRRRYTSQSVTAIRPSCFGISSKQPIPC